MKKNQVIPLVCVVLAAGLTIAYFCLAGMWANTVEQDVAEIVYVDSKTGTSVVLASRLVPETNPATGEKTMFPGRYCQECKAWKLAGLQNSPQNRRSVKFCPIHKTPMSATGPLPE